MPIRKHLTASMFTNQPEERIHWEFSKFKIPPLDLWHDIPEHKISSPAVGLRRRPMILSSGRQLHYGHLKPGSLTQKIHFSAVPPLPPCEAFTTGSSWAHQFNTRAFPLRFPSCFCPTPGQRLRVTLRKYLLAGWPSSVSNRGDVCRAECLCRCQETLAWGRDWLIQHFFITDRCTTSTGGTQVKPTH